MLIKNFGEKHSRTGENYINLGILCDEIKDYDTTLEYYKKALSIYRNEKNN